MRPYCRGTGSLLGTLHILLGGGKLTLWCRGMEHSEALPRGPAMEEWASLKGQQLP